MLHPSLHILSTFERVRKSQVKHLNTSLKKAIALVTGAGSGLGQAAAIALAAEGATVAVTELPDRMERAEETVSRVAANGATAFAIELDVRSLESIAACVKSVVSRSGRIDVLVNNAGVNVRRRAFDVSETDWDTVIDVNMKGVFFMAQAVGRQMRDQSPSGGSIINIASIMGLVGYWDRVAYCSSKAAIINMGRVLAIEWGEHNIRVNAVAPTFVETPLTKPLFESQPEFTADVHARTLTDGLPKPDEIAGAVVYLASAQARSITGQVLTVDGGWTAH